MSILQSVNPQGCKWPFKERPSAVIQHSVRDKTLTEACFFPKKQMEPKERERMWYLPALGLNARIEAYWGLQLLSQQGCREIHKRHLGRTPYPFVSFAAFPCFSSFYHHLSPSVISGFILKMDRPDYLSLGADRRGWARETSITL